MRTIFLQSLRRITQSYSHTPLYNLPSQMFRPMGHSFTHIRKFSDTPQTHRVAIILSGNGVYDGSEVTEVVACAVHLSRAGYKPVFYAPDMNQYHVIDHTKGFPDENDTRNVLVEAARIARGEICPLSDLDVNATDAIIFPGGFGAAKNLSNFAEKGSDMTVHPDVERVIKGFYNAAKPIGLCCIAPVLAAKLIPGVYLTVGGEPASDEWPHGDTPQAIRDMGAQHVERKVSEAYTDQENRIVSAPAYMANAMPHEVFDSVGKMIDGVLCLLHAKE